MDYYLDLLLIPIQIIIFIYTIYLLILMFVGLWKHKEVKIYAPKNRFAIIICAHNEACVIASLIDNLKLQEYPKALFDIFVVADNCTDDTKLVAEQAGAIVYERTDARAKGKGYAMGWMFDRLLSMDTNYDAFCIFDADNLVHPKFLQEMNWHLEKGEHIIQGYLNAKNPVDTWISGCFSIAFWMVNHMVHLAKYRLGLSTALGGTGMCFRANIVRKYGWGCTSLTEDMEYSMKMLTRGIRTCWAHDAIIYDEKVLTFMQSWNQRLRWAQGQFDCAGRYIPQLFIAGIRQRNLKILDGIMQVSGPYFMMLSTIMLLLSLVNTYVAPIYTSLWQQILPMSVLSFIGIAQYVVPLLILLQIKVPFKIYLYYLIYPIFVYSWMIINILGFFRRHKTEWHHTKHIRAVSMSDIKLTRMNDVGNK